METILFSEFRDRLRLLMQKRHMAVDDLANLTGLPGNTLQNIWKASRKMFPYADDLYKIAKALNVSFDFLITGKEERSNVSDPDIRQIITELELLKQVDSYQVESIAEQIHALMLLKTSNHKNNDKKENLPHAKAK